MSAVRSRSSSLVNRKAFSERVLLIAALLFTSVSTYAASIAVDFTGDNPGGVDGWRLAPQDVAGVVAQPNWNTVSTLGGGDDIEINRGTTGILLDNTGKATQVKLHYSGNDSWRTESTFDTPNAKMMKGVIKQFSQGTPLILSFTNVPAGSYDVYVYGNVDAGPVEVDISIGNKTNYWSEPGFFEDAFGFYESNSTDPSYRPEGNYVVFTNVSPVSDAITVHAYYRGGGNAAGIAGVQLVSAADFPGFEGPTAMGVRTQVTNTTVYSGTLAAFTFAATNNASEPVPVTYQWYQNDQLVPGATGQQLIFLARTNDNGARIYARASVPPEYSTTDLSVYSATGIVTVLPGVIYTNGLKVEHFPGATREEVEDYSAGLPTYTFVAPGFELPADTGLNNYARRVSGYFIPPASGAYVFFISADDDADLFLSTSEDLGQKRLIAQEENWSDPREWAQFSSGNSALAQKRSDQWSPDGGATMPYSEGIQLNAGQRYYIEGVQHQGAGGDNFAVTYKLMADQDPTDGDAPLLHATNRNVAYMAGPATSLVWEIQPTNVVTAAAQPLTLTSLAVTDSELRPVYQWYRDNAAVAGATGASYSFIPKLADDNAQFFVIAQTAQGNLAITSAVAKLEVNANDRVVLTFSDQIGNDVPANPNPYAEQEGLPAGLTATFEGFSNWNGSDDHTPTSDDYLLYGDQYDPGSISRVIFNMPVEVPSVWTATSAGGGQQGVATIVGYLGETEQFRTILDNAGLAEFTLGAGRLVDRMEFIDYGDSWIDDMAIVKPALLTFSDQVGNDVPANPSVYTVDQGLPAGVTATFQGFNNWNGSQDHTPTADNYLLYGNETGNASITFDVPVFVPSLWVSTQGGGQPGRATIKGLLGGVEKFTYTISASGFVEITNGVATAIDTLRFSSYADAWVDDLTVLKAPPPPPPAPPMITFSNQQGNDVPADPSVYTDAHGLPTGVAATFAGFSNWNGSDDHTPTGDDYLLYGDQYDAGSVSSLTFNRPVEVPSFWVSAEGGGQPGVATIRAFLGSTLQFTHVVQDGGFAEVTAGVGKSIDRIEFTDYGDSWIDDIVVQLPVAVPTLEITRDTSASVIISWTGKGTLLQSTNLTNWAPAPSQANPQTVRTTGDRMFFRVQAQ